MTDESFVDIYDYTTDPQADKEASFCDDQGNCNLGIKDMCVPYLPGNRPPERRKHNSRSERRFLSDKTIRSQNSSLRNFTGS